MHTRKLGRTGIDVSAVSFGCGAVGGLMTRGDPRDQERAVAFAIDHGITYFDTAPQYGSGSSEENLGRILGKLRPKVAVGTKVRLAFEDYGRIGATVTAALDQSLRRLGRDSVDLYQLHNRATARSQGDGLAAQAFLAEVAPAFEKLRAAGKVRHIGITALGETPALLTIVRSGVFDTAQVCFNALNPTAARTVPAGYPAQDYAQLLVEAGKARMGTIGIRVLAAGALSGSEARHPLNVQSVDPIGSGSSFAEDVARARLLEPMVREGHVASLPELAIRFAISQPELSTALVGLADQAQLEAAVAAGKKGPLSQSAMTRLAELQDRLV